MHGRHVEERGGGVLPPVHLWAGQRTATGYVSRGLAMHCTRTRTRTRTHTHIRCIRHPTSSNSPPPTHPTPPAYFATLVCTMFATHLPALQ